MTHKRLAVLELAMGLDVGGAETHVVSLSRSLAKMGWDVEVASSGGRRVKDLEAAGIVHHKVPLASRNPVEMLRAHRMLRDILESRRFDIVHAHARIPAWIATRLQKQASFPLVTTYHWTFVSGFPWNLVTRAGDWTIAVSPDIKDYVTRQFGFDPGKITVVVNGIDCDEFRPLSGFEAAEARRAFGIPENAPVIAYASRMTKPLGKVACDTVEAALSLRSDYPEMRILIAGDGEYLEQVKRAADEANRRAGSDFVQCLGFVSDMAPFYQVSDVVIGMSRVAMEGMACGKPAIIAGPSGDYGLVTEDKAPALEAVNFTSRDAPIPIAPEGLAAEIRAVLEGRGIEAARFGLQYIRQHHSVMATTAEVEKVYLRMLEPRS
ncbi:MAG: glycosyltransferase family 4 protein [Bacillota bacterium]